MSNFQEFQMSYNWGWVTIEQLQTAVQQGQITAEEYKEITNEALPVHASTNKNTQEKLNTSEQDSFVFPRG